MMCVDCENLLLTLPHYRGIFLGQWCVWTARIYYQSYLTIGVFSWVNDVCGLWESIVDLTSLSGYFPGSMMCVDCENLVDLTSLSQYFPGSMMCVDCENLTSLSRYFPGSMMCVDCENLTSLSRYFPGSMMCVDCENLLSILPHYRGIFQGQWCVWTVRIYCRPYLTIAVFSRVNDVCGLWEPYLTIGVFSWVNDVCGLWESYLTIGVFSRVNDVCGLWEPYLTIAVFSWVNDVCGLWCIVDLTSLSGYFPESMMCVDCENLFSILPHYWGIFLGQWCVWTVRIYCQPYLTIGVFSWVNDVCGLWESIVDLTSLSGYFPGSMMCVDCENLLSSLPHYRGIFLGQWCVWTVRIYCQSYLTIGVFSRVNDVCGLWESIVDLTSLSGYFPGSMMCMDCENLLSILPHYRGIFLGQWCVWTVRIYCQSYLTIGVFSWVNDVCGLWCIVDLTSLSGYFPGSMMCVDCDVLLTLPHYRGIFLGQWCVWTVRIYCQPYLTIGVFSWVNDVCGLWCIVDLTSLSGYFPGSMMCVDCENLLSALPHYRGIFLGQWCVWTVRIYCQSYLTIGVFSWVNDVCGLWCIVNLTSLSGYFPGSMMCMDCENLLSTLPHYRGIFLGQWCVWTVRIYCQPYLTIGVFSWVNDVCGLWESIVNLTSLSGYFPGSMMCVDCENLLSTLPHYRGIFLGQWCVWTVRIYYQPYLTIGVFSWVNDVCGLWCIVDLISLSGYFPGSMMCVDCDVLSTLPHYRGIFLGQWCVWTVRIYCQPNLTIGVFSWVNDVCGLWESIANLTSLSGYFPGSMMCVDCENLLSTLPHYRGIFLGQWCVWIVRIYCQPYLTIGVFSRVNDVCGLWESTVNLTSLSGYFPGSMMCVDCENLLSTLPHYRGIFQGQWCVWTVRIYCGPYLTIGVFSRVNDVCGLWESIVNLTSLLGYFPGSMMCVDCENLLSILPHYRGIFLGQWCVWSVRIYCLPYLTIGVFSRVNDVCGLWESIVTLTSLSGYFPGSMMCVDCENVLSTLPHYRGIFLGQWCVWTVRIYWQPYITIGVFSRVNDVCGLWESIVNLTSLSGYFPWSMMCVDCENLLSTLPHYRGGFLGQWCVWSVRIYCQPYLTIGVFSWANDVCGLWESIVDLTSLSGYFPGSMMCVDCENLLSTLPHYRGIFLGQWCVWTVRIYCQPYLTIGVFSWVNDVCALWESIVDLTSLSGYFPGSMICVDCENLLSTLPHYQGIFLGQWCVWTVRIYCRPYLTIGVFSWVNDVCGLWEIIVDLTSL